MKISLSELKRVVAEVVAEASGKKKPKGGDSKPPEAQASMKADEKLDFSKPQGEDNLYRKQGAANMGPYTAESALRHVVREAIREAIAEDLVESAFSRLKNKLSHKKGVKDPAALAASIGRKKYGAKGMAKKAAAGKKK